MEQKRKRVYIKACYCMDCNAIIKDIEQDVIFKDGKVFCKYCGKELKLKNEYYGKLYTFTHEFYRKTRKAVYKTKEFLLNTYCWWVSHNPQQRKQAIQNRLNFIKRNWKYLLFYRYF